MPDSGRAEECIARAVFAVYVVAPADPQFRPIMDTTTPELAQLQEQMHQVRMDLGEEVYDLVENARAMTDWRVHWRRHPLAFCAAAALAGYLVVPSRRSN